MTPALALRGAIEAFVAQHVAGDWVRLRSGTVDIKVPRGDATTFAALLSDRLPFSLSGG